MIQDNLDGQFDARDSFLIAPPGRSSPSGSVPYRIMPLEKNLFMEGRDYQLGYALESASGSAQLTVTISENSPPMSELAIEGQSIQYLILRG